MITTKKHYYGNLVRILFVVGAVFMMIGLPTMTRVLDIPIGFGIIGMVVLVLAAGFTNPAEKSSLMINTFISVIYFMVCAYFTWYLYTTNDGQGGFLFANQIAAILFLIAIYFAVKSWRGASIPEIPEAPVIPEE